MHQHGKRVSGIARHASEATDEGDERGVRFGGVGRVELVLIQRREAVDDDEAQLAVLRSVSICLARCVASAPPWLMRQHPRPGPLQRQGRRTGS